MTNQALVDTEQLKTLTGYRRPGDIERWLRTHGIRFFPSKNGPVTTTDSLNSALGVKTKPADDSADFEFI
jgi:hypothetical protein